ncbi:5871_t:CDS:2 [Ambispora leptoticha]|uniref:5871_t:CDS:1 n=1 Tax=Ambispora leptoticha TaxID=144679 RepID=A0A9N8WJ49_9GLOM|nr:5871_t:CDS:2 [Ambispora leptoticha]
MHIKVGDVFTLYTTNCLGYWYKYTLALNIIANKYNKSILDRNLSSEKALQIRLLLPLFCVSRADEILIPIPPVLYKKFPD